VTAERRGFLLFCAAVAALTAVRLLGLMLATTDLYVDEAQYAVWAQTPAWGYYSKPPMIAWLIGGAASVCGWGEACVRAPSTLVWAITPLFVFLAADTLFGRRVAWFAGLGTLLAPGAAFSTRIISTDAPLLMFWSLALLAFVRLRAGGGWGWVPVLGAAIGLGLLSKYAMAYVLGCAVAAAMADRDSRRVVLSWKGLAVLGVALLVLSPNILWNLANGLATARHTADNASGGGLTPGLADPLEFLAAQLALAGPVVLVGFGLAAWKARRAGAEPADRMLLAFSLPIFAVLTVVAILTRAHGNWAATALPAVWILGSALLVREEREGWLKGGLAFGAFMQVVLLAADVAAEGWVLNGKPPFHRTLGWEPFSEGVAETARLAGGRTVVVESRREAAALAHYAKDRPLAVAAWPARDPAAPEDHFQMSRPLTAAASGPVIAVSPCEDAARFANSFGRVEPLGRLATPVGRGEPRVVWLYRLSEPKPTVARPLDCPAS